MNIIENFILRIKSFLISKKETRIYKITKYIFLKYFFLISNFKKILNILETFLLKLILPLFNVFFKLYFQGSKFKSKSNLKNINLKILINAKRCL